MPLLKTWSFTTEDPDAPVVSGQSPGEGWYAVPKDYAVEFDITDDGAGLDTSSLVVTVGGVTVYTGGAFVTPTYDGALTDMGGGTWHFELTTHPDFGSYATVNVTVDAQDLHSPVNVMPTVSWSFDVEDYELPYVDAGFYPPDLPAGVDIPLDALITFTLKDDGAGVDLGTLQVTVGGVDAIVNGEFVSPFDGTGSEITGTPASYGVVIDASPDYDEWTTYAVVVNVDDLAVAGPVIPAMFDDAVYPFEGFEGARDADVPFVPGSAVSATFDDGAATEEEFELWD